MPESTVHKAESQIDCMESWSFHDTFLLSWDCKGFLSFQLGSKSGNWGHVCAEENEYL